jgi:hypothetical protein
MTANVSIYYHINRGDGIYRLLMHITHNRYARAISLLNDLCQRLVAQVRSRKRLPCIAQRSEHLMLVAVRGPWYFVPGCPSKESFQLFAFCVPWMRLISGVLRPSEGG